MQFLTIPERPFWYIAIILPTPKECRQIFYKGAEDTIIRLPDHVGVGPWARIVSMKPVKQLVKRGLPDWVFQKKGTQARTRMVRFVPINIRIHIP